MSIVTDKALRPVIVYLRYFLYDCLFCNLPWVVSRVKSVQMTESGGKIKTTKYTRSTLLREGYSSEDEDFNIPCVSSASAGLMSPEHLRQLVATPRVMPFQSIVYFGAPLIPCEDNRTEADIRSLFIGYHPERKAFYANILWRDGSSGVAYKSWPGCDAYGTRTDAGVQPYPWGLYVCSTTGQLYISSAAYQLQEVGASA